jgi:hypothetical protein
MANFQIDRCQESEFTLFSVSMYLYTKVENFRNKTEEMGTFEMYARRVVGELAYAGIALTAVIETVFRGIIAIIVSPFLVIPEDQKNEKRGFFQNVVHYNIFGAIFSGEACALALVSLVDNLYQEKIVNQNLYEQIIPEIFDRLNQELVPNSN